MSIAACHMERISTFFPPTSKHHEEEVALWGLRKLFEYSHTFSREWVGERVELFRQTHWKVCKNLTPTPQHAGDIHWCEIWSFSDLSGGRLEFSIIIQFVVFGWQTQIRSSSLIFAVKTNKTKRRLNQTRNDVDSIFMKFTFSILHLPVRQRWERNGGISWDGGRTLKMLNIFVVFVTSAMLYKKREKSFIKLIFLALSDFPFVFRQARSVRFTRKATAPRERKFSCSAQAIVNGRRISVTSWIQHFSHTWKSELHRVH